MYYIFGNSLTNFPLFILSVVLFSIFLHRLSSSFSPQKRNKDNNSSYNPQHNGINTFQPPTTSINCGLPPRCINSIKNSKTSGMLTNNNRFIHNGQNNQNKPLLKPRQKQKLEEENSEGNQQKIYENLKTTTERDYDEESMSTSILSSAAWYRDSKGRTGYRPQFDKEQIFGSRVQTSPVKMLSNKTQSLIDAHSVLKNDNIRCKVYLNLALNRMDKMPKDSLLFSIFCKHVFSIANSK